MLREYQHQAIDDLRAVARRGRKAPLLQMATGLGKTVVACEMIRSAVDKGKRALVLVPRRQLVYQTSEKLDAFDVPHGIIMSGERPSMMPDVQIASVHTLYRRCFENDEPVLSSFTGKGMRLPPADVLVIDEAHANFSHMAKSIIHQYPDAVKIGMTATPCRTDGRGLGEIYDSIASGPSVRWAMDNGFLSELRYFGPSDWDLSEVQIQAGDYNQKQLAKAVNQPTLVGDVVRNWERIAPDRTTVVFAVDRKHARALHEAFNGRGHTAEYIDGQTDNDERHEIFHRLESGESRVLCSVAVVDMGWDMPAASCAVLARPTKSLARYLQAVGRILRPAPGKEDAILIDHTGAVKELGFVDDPFQWSLEGVKGKDRSSTSNDPTDEVTLTCPGCKAVIKPAPKCPECGRELKSESKRAVEAKEAELQEIERSEQNRNRREWSMDDKRRFFGELRGAAKKFGYKEGWAVHAYKDRIGALPWPVYEAPALEPSEDTMGWVKHLRIKRAKRKQREAQAA